MSLIKSAYLLYYTCYIFSVRAYTDNGYGAWTFITSDTLRQQSPTISVYSKTIMLIIYVTVYFKFNYG